MRPMSTTLLDLDAPQLGFAGMGDDVSAQAAEVEPVGPVDVELLLAQVDELIGLMPWQREGLAEAFSESCRQLAISVPKGAGKSTLSGAVGALAVRDGGALARPRGRSYAVAAAQVQAEIVFESALDHFGIAHRQGRGRPRGGAPYRLVNNPATRLLESNRSGSRLQVLPCKADTIAGIQPSGVVIGDEPASWQHGQRVHETIRTQLGKGEAEARYFVIGTRAGIDDAGAAWWSDVLADDDPALHVIDYSAPMEADPFAPDTWHLANPSLRDPRFAGLLEQVAREAEAAKRNPSLHLAAFRAARLNQPVSGRRQGDPLVGLDAWDAVVADELPPAEGRPFVGIDVGRTQSLTAVAACWPATGRVEVVAAVGGTPSLADRGTADRVGRLYERAASEGHLIVGSADTRIAPLPMVLAECRERWGLPAAAWADQFGFGDLQDASGIEWPGVPLHRAPGGWKLTDRIRQFRAAILDGWPAIHANPLLEAAMSDAVLIVGVNGDMRLSRRAEAGRRTNARDDCAAALILALSAAADERREPAAPAQVWIGGELLKL